MKKRILSVFMAICLMLTLLPTAALAADYDEISSDYGTLSYGEPTGSGYSFQLVVKVNNATVYTSEVVRILGDVHDLTFTFDSSIYSNISHSLTNGTIGSASVDGGTYRMNSFQTSQFYGSRDEVRTLTISLSTPISLYETEENGGAQAATLEYLPGDYPLNVRLFINGMYADETGTIYVQNNASSVMIEHPDYYYTVEDSVKAYEFSTKRNGSVPTWNHDTGYLTLGHQDTSVSTVLDVYIWTFDGDNGLAVKFTRGGGDVGELAGQGFDSVTIQYEIDGKVYNYDWNDWEQTTRIPYNANVILVANPSEGNTFRNFSTADYVGGNGFIHEEGGLSDGKSYSNPAVVKYVNTAYTQANIFLYNSDPDDPDGNIQEGLDRYTLTGTIDDGTVSWPSEQLISTEDRSLPMTFTPSAGKEIVRVEVNGEKISFTTNTDGSYTYGATSITENTKVEVFTQNKGSPDPETPQKPDGDDVENLGLYARVTCEEDTSHTSRCYLVKDNDGGWETTDPVQTNGVWTSTLSILTTVYIETFDINNRADEIYDESVSHSLVTDPEQDLTVDLVYANGAWTLAGTNTNVSDDNTIDLLVACDTSSGGDLADNQIAIEVYLDGQQVEDENTFSNYVSHTSGPASDGTTGSGAWDTDLDAYVYTYGENTQNSAYVDLTVTHIDNNTIVQGIEADLVYGDGDPGITDQEDTFSLNNVTMRSTVKVYLNTVYTVAYSVPAGTAAPTDGGKYITVAALGSNDNDPPVEGGSSVEYRWINGAVGNDASDTYHTQITLEAVPTGLDGWYAEDNTTKYSGSETIDLTTASMDVLDANSDRTITFTAKETGPADITVTKDVTKVGTIEITSATDPIPSALAGDEIVWTITVQNVGGETQTTNVTITENLTGALITDPQNMHVTVNDNVITVKGLEANESVTITVTYTVTAADVEAGTAIKNSVTVDDGDGDPTTEETEDEVPVVEADILDVPKISHQVNTDPWHNSADTATVEHLVTTTNPTISYQAVLDLSAMELQNTSNTNQGFGPYTIYSIMNDDPWGKLTSSYWNLLDHDDTIINLCVKFDSQLDVTETAMQNVTVTSPYFERTGDPVTYDSTTGYWKIPCKAVDSPQTAGTDADDEVILSGITLNLTSAAQSALNTSKVLTLTSGGYIDGTVTFGGTLSALNPLTVYGEATDDVVNLALDAWDDGDNTETGGDGTPDYQQALIKYVSANTSYGTVNPATEVVTLTGMTGNTGTATISGSTASANSGYSFTNWTNTAGLSAVTSATLGAQTFTAQGGSTYTFTANFTSSGGSDPGTGGSESKPYLRFDSNGGTEFDPIDENGRDFSINVYHDEKYGDHIPTRPGYRFTGWYNTNTLRTRIDEDDILRVTSYRTVFAGWEETSVPGMLNGDDHYAYIQGYSDGTVRPNANITRAQVATIFFRLLDEDVRDDNLTTYNTFPDVDQDYWANTAISTMASLGVINGRNSGLFDPDAYITRAEFAAICARFDDSGVDGITTFTDTVGHWAEDEISRAAALGWIQGYADGTFRPNQYITRAQAVTMINRVLCRLPEDTDDLLSGMNTWTDCHEDDWFYLAIQEATNSHDFVAKDRVYESWTDLNRAPDWSRYE